MKPFTYPKPVKPPIVRAMDAIHKTFNEGMRISDRPGPNNTVDGLLIATRALIAEQEIARDISDEDRRDLAEYNRQVTLYNEQVKRYNAQLRLERDQQAAAYAQAELRKNRCDKCFTLHGPGQVECW